MRKLVSYLIITCLLNLLICSHFIASWVLLIVGGAMTHNANLNIMCLVWFELFITVVDDVVHVCLMLVDVVARIVVLSNAGLFISWVGCRGR